MTSLLSVSGKKSEHFFYRHVLF